jgi:hypothetical protein
MLIAGIMLGMGALHVTLARLVIHQGRRAEGAVVVFCGIGWLLVGLVEGFSK